MVVLAAFSFLAGIVTVLSPCILPILPIVLSGSITGGKKRPLGIVLGFILSFSFFTLFLTKLVEISGISASHLRNFSVVIIFLFGLSLLVPKFQVILEQLFVKLGRFTPAGERKDGFWAGILVGFSVGLLWTPCVGPILGSVISLAALGTIGGSSVVIVLLYSLGTALPMLAIVYGGRNLLTRVPWLLSNTQKIQKAFGVLMIVTALAVYFGFDRNFQSYILDKFPGYGTGLTKFEDNQLVKEGLNKLEEEPPMFDKTINAPEIIPGGSWINSDPLKISQLRGKVVMVDFWTYTCINCIRTLPYLRSWHEKYADLGLVIIGVHTPEFEFEKDINNLKKSVSDFNLTYPIVQDNDYQTWRAYSNRYWPAKYLINKDGKIVYSHFGEGEYDETEEVIQQLLREKGADVNLKIDNPKYKNQTMTPELYLGYSRMGYFAEPEQLVINKKKDYQLPYELAPHHFAFGGTWQVMDEYSESSTGSTLLLGYEAKDVFLVMRAKENSAIAKVYLDDNEVKTIMVDKDQLYELIKENKSGKHLLKLEFIDNQVQVFAFTFG